MAVGSGDWPSCASAAAVLRWIGAICSSGRSFAPRADLRGNSCWSMSAVPARRGGETTV